MKKIGLIKKVAILLCIIMVFQNYGTVFAGDIKQENEKKGEIFSDDFFISSGEVWSEDKYNDWILKWKKGKFFDLLEKISNGDSVVEFKYDEHENRIEKKVNGKKTSYIYDKDNDLIYEDDGLKKIEYIYIEKVDDDRKKLFGFQYENQKYYYVFDEYDNIIGIQKDNDIIVKYEYVNEAEIYILGMDNQGIWIDKSNDSTFVGCINPYRYNGQYYDVETGWYWAGRYYDLSAHRYIDGISEAIAKEMENMHGNMDEIFLKTYTLGLENYFLLYEEKNINTYDSEKMNIRSTENAQSENSDIMYIAGVIYGESRAYFPDQKAVAWTIKKRMESNEGRFANLSKAYDVVTIGGEYCLPEYPENKSDRFWLSALLSAKKLYDGENPSDGYPDNYYGQLFFNSITTFRNRASFAMGYLNEYYQRVPFSNVSIVGHGKITNDVDLLSSTVDGFIGKRNVFFSY